MFHTIFGLEYFSTGKVINYQIMFYIKIITVPSKWNLTVENHSQETQGMYIIVTYLLSIVLIKIVL